MNEPTQHTALSEAELDAVADRVFEKIKALIGGSAIKALIFIMSTAVIAVLGYLGFSHSTHGAP